MRRALLGLAVGLVALVALAPAARAAPTNDALSAAEPLSSAMPATGSGTNLEATKEAGEPDHAGDPGGHSVWYSWTPMSTGPVRIGTGCFGNLDALALVAVYTGSAVDALTPVASNQGFPPPTCFGESAEVEFSANAGTTYRIAVDGKSGAQGSFTLNLNGTPENDDFADAVAITGELPQVVSGSTKLAGVESGEPDHAGGPGGHSVWYSWTPSASGPVAISTCSSFFALDTLLAVTTGDSVDSLTQVASNDDAPRTEGFPGCASSNSEVRFDATAGTTYRIAVDSTGGTVGRFSLRLRGRPANDDFSDAQTISPPLDPSFPSGAFQVTTDMATKQAGEPAHAGQPGGQSVWFSWTPSASGQVFVSTCTHEGPEDPDTLLTVYTGSTVDSLTPVASNDDDPSPSCRSTDSATSFPAVASTTYWIAVDAKSQSKGRFDLLVESAPTNDDLAAAKSLGSSTPAFASGSTKSAGKQSGEPDHAGVPGGHSVWYSWTPSSSGPVVVTACPYTERVVTLLAVYTGSGIGALSPVDSNAGGASCSPNGSEIAIEAVAGTTYQIAVDGEGGNLGPFSLDVRGRPSNDDFATPEVLSPAPMSAGGTNRLATVEAGEPSHAGQPGGHSVWYSWTPSTSGPVDISSCGHTREIDTLLAVYTGAAVDSLASVASSDDASGPPANELCEFSRGNSEVEFQALAGTTYRIAVDGKGGSVGEFGLAFEGGPENDDFDAARQLSASLPAYGGAVTKLAGKEAGEPAHAGDAGGHSVWYSWTPTSDGPVAVSACSYWGDLEPLLAVYTGSTLGSLTPVAAGGGEAPGYCRNSGSEAQFDAVAGTTYEIAVDGRGFSAGGFQLILEGVAPNDDFGRALSLGGGLPARNFFFSNRFATKQAGEPDHAGEAGGASLWFKWTAPVSADVSVDTCGSGFDTLLAVYSGSALNALAPIASNDDGGGKCSPQSKLVFSAVANTTYRIAVDGKGDAQGPIQLNVEAKPANDDFTAAEKTPAALGWYWTGTTRLATKEGGEPNHGGDPGGHSVWYSWTPSKSAAVELDVCAAGFDPVLGVYTGSALGGLTAVATSDAGAGQCDEGRSFGFEAVAGTTYRIAVDGAAGDDGYFELHLRPAIEHPRSLSVSSAGAGSVTLAANAVACASLCSYNFEVGESVTLSASPAPSSSFTGWSGGCAGTGACQVTLNTDTAVVANFSSAAGGGGGGESPRTAPTPSPRPAPKPLHCRRGFRKVLVRGKAKCVKRQPRHHHRKRRHGVR